MDGVLETIRNDVTVETLSLDFRDISDLTPLLEELAIIPQLSTLDLHGNKLISLPVDMSCLRQLRTLNLEENQFENITNLLPGLQSLPMLRDLCISFNSMADEEQVIKALPDLQALNGTILNEAGRVSPTKLHRNRSKSNQSGEKDNVSHVSITQRDLESVAVLYGAAKALKGKLSHDQDLQLTEFFDNHVQRVMKELSSKLTQVKDPFLRQGELLMAKHELYEVCFHEVIQHAQSSSPEFGAVLRKLRAVHRELFHDFPGVLKDMRPHYLQRLSDLHAEVLRSEKESSLLLEAAEVLEKEAAQHVEEKERMQLQSDVARRKLAEENARLKARSQYLEEQLSALKNSDKSSPRGPTSPLYIETTEKRRLSSPRNQIGSKQINYQQQSPQQSPSKSPAKSPSRLSKGMVKELPLKQLKDYIEQIYTSKLKFDKKCRKSRLPRETMEQHMYTFLNQKYGLKSLIIDHASAIIKAVQLYGDDNDVKVFGKILRNEIDEEFRFVQQQLKETVSQLVREGLKVRFPLKGDKAIDLLYKNKVNSTLKEAEWSEIIRFMYNQNDCVELTSRISAIAEDIQKEQVALDSSTASLRRRRSNHASPSPRSPSNRSVIPYMEFLKILLNFQLVSHESFIERFQNNFSKFDSDGNGIIDETEFRAFVHVVSPRKTDEQVEELLEVVDPWNHQQITFSEVVKVLSPELFQVGLSADVSYNAREE